ncbi:MAG: molybdopterin molybdotransferase MoeA [Myxococcales bacterium]|nr:molybdopterin molybdotransferase MoeA [Myxococcales bacterium]
MSDISVAEAHAAIRAAVEGLPRARERVALGELGGRVLAEPLLATFPQPRFDNSAMDGYAVRAADVAAATRERPVKLEVVGVAAAGSPHEGRLAAGQAAQVMTGGVLPDGADAVVMVESTSGYTDAAVEIYQAVDVGAHIRRRGEEIVEGEELLAAGQLLGPVEVGTLATFGCAEAEVTRRPRVAIFATGDELVEPGQALAPGQIYNSNFHVLRQLCSHAGAQVVIERVLRDDVDELARFLSDAVTRCDVLVSSGGVSMGRFDHVRDVASDIGLERRFWKVAQKPGRPLLFASSDETLFFGLPGNPVSSTICFVEYVRPALLALAGAPPPKKIHARLAAPFPRQASKHRFLFGEIHADEQGQLLAAPTRKLGSHMLTSGVGANALLEAPAGDGPLEPGATILVTPLR